MIVALLHNKINNILLILNRKKMVAEATISKV